MLVDDAITVTLLGRSSIPRVGPVCVTRTFSVRGLRRWRCRRYPETHRVALYHRVRHRGDGHRVCWRRGSDDSSGDDRSGDGRSGGAVDDAVTVTKAEAAGPTVYPSPSVTDAVIMPLGPVVAVGTVSIAASSPASIVIVVGSGSAASSAPVNITCTVRSATGAGEAVTVYDTGSPAATMSESARIVTLLSVLCWGASGVTGTAVVVSGTTLPLATHRYIPQARAR